MRRTRVRVRVEFEDCDVDTTGGDAIGVASPAGEGCFQVDFDSSLDLDIDTNEAALTRACAPALRDGLRTQLADVAKKRAIKAAGPGARVVSSCTPYPVDGEVGRFSIPTYEVEGARATVRTRDMFPTLRGKAHYLSKGFREIALLSAHCVTAQKVRARDGLDVRACPIVLAVLAASIVADIVARRTVGMAVAMAQ